MRYRHLLRRLDRDGRSLSVTATGRGTVTGGGISCGNGKAACTAKVSEGSTVGLTATAGPGARFSGWSGACSGNTPTCTLEMNAAKEVVRLLPGGGGTSGPARSVTHRLGPPLVGRTATGFQVTLRFHSACVARRGCRRLRAGRIETALAFTAAAGDAVAGPFPVGKPGFYTFELHVGGRDAALDRLPRPLRRARGARARSR